MITSEEIIKNIIQETGLVRSGENIVPNVLSKQEMKDILVYIVNLKNKFRVLLKEQKSKEETIEEVLNRLSVKVVADGKQKS